MNKIMLFIICSGLLSLIAMDSPRDEDVLESPKEKELFEGPALLGIEKNKGIERIKGLLIQYYIFSWAHKPENKSSAKKIPPEYRFQSLDQKSDASKKRVSFADDQTIDTSNKDDQLSDLKKMTQQEISKIRKHWHLHREEIGPINAEAKQTAWSQIQEFMRR